MDKKKKKIKQNFTELRRLLQYIVSSKYPDLKFKFLLAPPNISLTNSFSMKRLFVFNVPAFNYDCQRLFSLQLKSKFELKDQVREILAVRNNLERNDFQRKDEFLCNVKKFCHDYLFNENICDSSPSKENKDNYLKLIEHQLEMFHNNQDLYYTQFKDHVLSTSEMILNNYPLKQETIDSLHRSELEKLQDYTFHSKESTKTIDKVSKIKNHQKLSLAKFDTFNSFTNKNRPIPKCFSLDCEMVICEKNGEEMQEIGRVTVVNIQEEVLFDEYCIPTNKIKDYNTRWSGITSKHFEHCSNGIKDIQNKLDAFICCQDQLVGHGLDNDLVCMQIVHLNNLDTSILYKNFRGNSYKPKLKILARQILLKTIQVDENEGHYQNSYSNSKKEQKVNNDMTDDNKLNQKECGDKTEGHDSIEDSRCAMNLCILHMLQAIKLFSHEEMYVRQIVNLKHIFSMFSCMDWEINMTFEKEEWEIKETCDKFINLNKEKIEAKDVHIFYLDQLAKWHEQTKNEDPNKLNFNVLNQVQEYYNQRNQFISKFAVQINTLMKRQENCIFVFMSTFQEKKLKNVIQDKKNILNMIVDEEFKQYHDNYGKYEFMILNS